MSQSAWTKEHLERVFDDFLGDLDPGTSQGRKRGRILKAATELFMAQGYRKTRVEEIAKRANVAKGTVYLYFESKGLLLAHAIGLEKRVLLGLLDPILSGEIPERERLRFYVKLMLTIARELPLVARLMRGDGEILHALEDIDPELLAQGQVQGEEWLMELIELAAPGIFDDAQRRARADVILALRYFTGLLLNEQVRAGRDLDAFAALLADMLVYGAIRPPPAAPEGAR